MVGNGSNVNFLANQNKQLTSCSSSFVNSLGQLTVCLALRASLANSQLPLSKALGVHGAVVKTWILIVLLSMSFHTMAKQCLGVVVIYLPDTESDPELISDFGFFYNSIYKTLNTRNLETVFIEKLPSKINTCLGYEVEVKPTNFELGVGYVLIGPQRKTKYMSGVVTDIDLLQEIDAFFK